MNAPLCPRNLLSLSHALSLSVAVALAAAFLLSLGSLCLCHANPSDRPASSVRPTGWDYAGRILADEALREFRAAERDAEKSGIGNANATGNPNANALREARMGQAISLINAQPKTEGNLDEAVRLLAEVQKGGDRNDDISVTARYYTARIAQIHRYVPDEKLAARLFLELFTERPDNEFAQIGMVKYAMLRLYSADIPSAERAKTLAELEQYVPRLTNRLALRDFHAELGKAYLYSGLSREKALDHFLAQDHLGVQRFTAKAETFLRIAGIAKDLGRKDLALEYYGKFITQYPRDTRNYSAVMLAREIGGNFAVPADPDAGASSASPDSSSVESVSAVHP